MSPAVASQPEITTQQYTQLHDRLNNLMTINSTDPTLRVRTAYTSEFFPEDYQYLKWYTTLNENQLFDGDGY